MPRILIAQCMQEVSTFSPHQSVYDDFSVRWGDDLLDYHRTVHGEIGGAISVFDATQDVEMVPAYGACFITSGGTLSAAGWDRIASECVAAIAAAPPVDGVYFCMHGAMAAQNELDPEGWLLSQVREILGESIPIVTSLDLHGILTERMVKHSDAIVAYHTYPHVDFFETGQRAAKLLLRIIAKEVRPVTARVAIPALVRGDELITSTGLFGKCIAQAKEIENSSPSLSAGFFIGNPFTDVPSLQTYSFVVTDNDPATAEREAMQLAKTFWTHHEAMTVHLKSLSEMVACVKSHTGGTIAIIDAADATSSGASGDSNAVVKTLLQHEYRGRILVPIVDPAAVQMAFDCGIGSTIETTLGGLLDQRRFEPMPVTARVRLLSDGAFRSESFGEQWAAGPTAVLQAGNVTFVVSSRAVSLYDRSFFFAHGQNPQHFDAVVVKSPHCQPHMYAQWCSMMLNVDAPGSSSANLKTLGHTRCPRPMFPLDDNVFFAPTATLFKRT